MQDAALGDAAAAQAFQARETLRPCDVAASILQSLAVTSHVNVSRAELYPVQQASGGFAYAD